MQDARSTYVLVLASPEMGSAELDMLSLCGRNYPVIAVDGGYRWCECARVPVAHAIGDFDSLGFVPEGVDASVHSCKKDKSDCELALDFAQSLGARRILVFAAFGGRVDHAMSVYQQLARSAEQGMEITALGDDFALRVLVGPSQHHLPALPRGIVSLLSASEKCTGIDIEGLAFPLQDAELSNRMSLCLSNELIGKPAAVSVVDGTLFLIAPVECFPECFPTRDIAG